MSYIDHLAFKEPFKNVSKNIVSSMNILWREWLWNVTYIY